MINPQGRYSKPITFPHSLLASKGAIPAMRDLCRARTDAVQDLRRSRAQLKAFLLRNGVRYAGKAAWTEAHRRYLRELVLPHGAQRVVLEDSLRAITTAQERIQRLEDQMAALLESWHMKPVVEALM